MAYLRKHPKSPFWIAGFTDRNGRRTNRTTRLLATHANRPKAQRIAEAYEQAYRQKDAVAFLREQFSALARQIDPESVSTVPTVKEYFDQWREAHGGELAPRTLVSYDLRLRQFVDHVGEELTVDCVKPSHALAFRAKIKRSASAATANHAVKILRAVFNCAMKDGIRQGNPFILKSLKGDAAKKEAFTVEQVQRLLRVADPEWRSMITFGIFTGQRLGDIAMMTWAQIDFDKREIRFQTEKTGRRMAIPACDALWAHILTLQRGTPTAPLHPRACETRERFGIGLVSRDFTRVMVDAGLCKARPFKRKREKEGDVSREVNPLTFHSLRHSAASWLRDAGVSESLAMEIVGHDSVSVARAYVHSDAKLMREALNRLPKLA